MSEAKKPAAMVEIHPGSPEWQAWLTYHRGTKTETRMLLCLGGKTKAGDVVPPRPWLARSKMPPAPPSPSGIRPSSPQVAGSWAPPTVHASAPEGRIDQIVERMEVAEARRAKENEIDKRRRKKAKHSDDVLEEALEAVKINRTPYINGAENLGTLKVPDPLEEQEIIRAGRGHFTVKKKNSLTAGRFRRGGLKRERRADGKGGRQWPVNLPTPIVSTSVRCAQYRHIPLAANTDHP